MDTDYAAMRSGQVHSDKFVEEIRREFRAGIIWRFLPAGDQSEKPHKINLNTCSDSATTLPVETGGRPHCDKLEYLGTTQTGQTSRKWMRRQMNRRHRLVFMTSTPTYASETGTDSVLEIERQANNGWVNATQSNASISELGYEGPDGRLPLQENDENDNQQMSLAEKEQILDAGTSSTPSESGENNSEEE